MSSSTDDLIKKKSLVPNYAGHVSDENFISDFLSTFTNLKHF